MNKHLFILLLATIIGSELIDCKIISKTWRSEELTLDLEGKYNMSWELDEKRERVTFNVNVETTGYIALGISPNGGMKGADFFIGGVDPEGNPYYSDRHLPSGSNNGQPIKDIHEDWTLIKSNEDKGTTSLMFSRLLNTCDDQDYPITENDTVRLIWAFGETDELLKHKSRGSVSLNIMESEESNEDTADLQQWKMRFNGTMPKYDTSYWCTIHKRNNFPGGAHQIVGFDAHLGNDLAKRHTHHFIIYKCRAPNGENADAIFGDFVDTAGEECYSQDENSQFPKQYCPEYLFVWAVGGKATWFPKDVGYPIEEAEEGSPYYMMEIHYDNPGSEEGIVFESGVTIYHTDVPREKKAGLMTVGIDPQPALTIPPDEPNFLVAGHCGSSCTKNFPSGGISVFNILLHSHFSGRKMKLRQFRGNRELPWMLSDLNYDFNFQQNKPIKEHIKVLPGDHLTYECIYDSTWNNGTIVYGGLSTRAEMCQTFLWYYPRANIDICGSSYNADQNYLDFGITNYTIDLTGSGEQNPIIWAPESMAGLNYSNALSTKFDWNVQFRKDFQQKRLFGVMDNVCVDRSEETPIATEPVKYPDICIEYVPDDVCTSEDESAVLNDDKCNNNGALSQMLNFHVLAAIVISSQIFNFLP